LNHFHHVLRLIVCCYCFTPAVCKPC